MDEPVSGILGREGELARVTSFIGSVPGGPSALLLEGAAGIGKTTLWQAGVSIARARGHRVLSCRGAEPEALLSYAALGDLFDFELPDLPAPQQRALDAALLRAELEGAPPDQRAVSVASLGVLRALAASGPVLVAIDDVQWLDVPSARALAFVVRRLEDAPVRVLVTLRVGSGGDPLGLGRTGPAPVLHRLPIGRLSEEAMTRLLRARTEGRLTHPILLRVHRMSEGNPLFALEIARALTEHGVRPAPGEPLPVPGDLQGLLGARLAALPSSAADGLLVVAAAARPTEDLVVAAAARPDRASADLRRAEQAGILQRAGGRLAFTHPLLGSTVYAAAMPQVRRSVHRRLADLVVDPEERARHLALAASGPHPDVARALEEAGRHARRGGAPDAAAELLELARTLTPPEDGLELLRRSVEAADYHFDAGDATRATALLHEAAAMARPGRDRARILFHLASISWLDMPRVQGLSEQALQEAGDAADIRAAIHEHLAWVGIYRGGLRRRARQRVHSVGAAGHRPRHPGRIAVDLRHGRVPDGPAGAGPHDRGRAAGRRGDAKESGGQDNRLHRIPDLSRTPAVVGGPAGRRPRGPPPGAVLGFLELSLSNPTAAMGRLEPVLAFLHELGSPEPGIIPCLPDLLQARGPFSHRDPPQDRHHPRPAANVHQRRHGANASDRTAPRAGLAAHRHRGGHGLRHGRRRGRRGRADDGDRGGRR